MNTTYCYLLEIDNFYYNTFDEDIEIDGLIYKHQSSLHLGVINHQIDTYTTATIGGSIHDECLKEEDILAGKFDNAPVIIKLYDYQAKKVIKTLFTGFIANISFDNNIFKADISGNSYTLDKKIMHTYTPFCRTSFGSKECGIDKEKYGYPAKILKIIDNSTFIIGLSDAKNAGFFNFGTLKYRGKTIEIKSFHNNTVVTTLPLFDISVDETITIYEGCSKRFECCIQKFNNAANFRGEPHIPGIQEILQRVR